MNLRIPRCRLLFNFHVHMSVRMLMPIMARKLAIAVLIRKICLNRAFVKVLRRKTNERFHMRVCGDIRDNKRSSLTLDIGLWKSPCHPVSEHDIGFHRDR